MPKWIKELHDAEWLRDAYANNTVKRIGEILNCAPSGVSQALKRHGIKARPPGQPSAPACLKDKEWVEAAYAKMTSHEIAEAIGCHQSTVMEALYNCGIEVRGHGRRRRKHPYKQIMDENGNNVLEHRHIMEKHLGRKLAPDEHVHHIDGVMDNNSISNLAVLSPSEHHRLHAKESGFGKHDRMMFDRICKKCGIAFKGANRRLHCDLCHN